MAEVCLEVGLQEALPRGGGGGAGAGSGAQTPLCLNRALLLMSPRWGPPPQREASSHANWGRGRRVSSALQSDRCDPETSEALTPTRLTGFSPPL